MVRFVSAIQRNYGRFVGLSVEQVSDVATFWMAFGTALFGTVVLIAVVRVTDCF
jgi:hypothetical protein